MAKWPEDRQKAKRKTYFYGAICVLSALGLIILTVYRYTRVDNTDITDNLIPPDWLSKSKEFHSTSDSNFGFMDAPDRKKPRDCSEILEKGYNKSGVYTVWPQGGIIQGKSINVYCDMDIPNEGWTVIQRRFLGSQKFNLKWRNYKHGFGNIMKEFWLGNENIFAMTNQGNCEVRFDLKTPEGEHRYAIYSNFRIDDDLASYTLHISGYSGNAGDGMKYHNGNRFVTKDNDQDEYARSLQGAWWFSEFPYVHLNGLYRPFVESLKCVHWCSGQRPRFLTSVEIKIRLKD
ncbi:techylectin-5A [Caerostris darwini]|uniref:Techylectin-5A n=1 Tax=Caerostris darwini TaxID=1538125 RepID=A0AAV4VGE6_9ARAC|nr:techylectin-5A [Caerostris darwini]